MPNTTRWSTFVCCLLVIQDFTVKVRGQQQNHLPTTGNGSAYASKCNAAKQSWVEASGSSFVSLSTYISTTQSEAQSTVYTTLTYLSDNATSATPYTLCDGYPRISGSRTITSTLVRYTTTSTTLVTTSVFTALPAPNCTINSRDCARLEEAYERAKSAYSSYEMTAGPDANSEPPVPTSPICGPATVVSATSRVGEAICAMNEASVQLLYWPVTVPSSCDSCHRSNCPTTTPAPSISGKANTAIWRNITLTSPTVYIAFEGSWSFSSDGKDYTEPAQLVIPQTADAVSTYCGKPGGGYSPPQKVNYANFNRPVPADVYRCQPSCYRDPLPYSAANYTATYTYTIGNTTSTITATSTTYLSIAPTNVCSTIWDDYAPVLSIPEAFKTIKPSGHVEFLGQESVCQFRFDENAVLFDPPIALTEAQTAAKPTLPAQTTARPTAAHTFTALPAQTGQPDNPNLHQSHATPGEHDPPQGQPTPQPGGGRIEQTATVLNVGGYIATGIGLTIPSHGGGQKDGGQNNGGQNNGGQNNGGQNNGGQNNGGQNNGGQNNGGQNNGGQNNGGQNNGGQNNGGVTIAVAPGGQGLVINGATTTIDAHAPVMTGSGSESGGSGGPGGSSSGSGSAEVGVITIGGQPRTFTKHGSQVVIDGQTITPGDSAVVAGQTISLSSDGTHLEIGTGSGKSTMELKPTATTSIAGGRTGYITATGVTLTYSVIDGTTMIDGTTLEPGSTVTLTSARPSASTTKDSSNTPSTGPGPSSTTSSDAAPSLMLDISDWRCQTLFMLGFMVLVAAL